MFCFKSYRNNKTPPESLEDIKPPKIQFASRIKENFLGGISEVDEEELETREIRGRPRRIISYASSRDSFCSTRTTPEQTATGSEQALALRQSSNSSLNSYFYPEKITQVTESQIQQIHGGFDATEEMSWAEQIYSNLLPSVGGVFQYTIGNAAMGIGSIVYNAGSTLVSSFLKYVIL